MHSQPCGSVTLKVDPDTVLPHDGRLVLIVVLVVAADVFLEVAFVVADEVVRAEVDAAVDAVVGDVARFPVATGTVPCWGTVVAALGSAVQAAGIADCGRALVAQTVTAPLTSRMATSPAASAAPVFMVRRGPTGSPEGGSAGGGGLYGFGSAGRGSSGGANSGRPPFWPH